MNVSIFHQQPHQQCSVTPAGSNDKYICSTAPKWVLIDGSVGKCRRLCAAVVGDRWACHISLVTTLDHRCASCLLPAYPTLAYPTPPLVKHKPSLSLQFLLLPRIPSIIFDKKLHCLSPMRKCKNLVIIIWREIWPGFDPHSAISSSDTGDTFLQQWTALLCTICWR